MSLIDANALINRIDNRQPMSIEFRKTFNTMRRPLMTTWPAFTEATYLLYGIGGWPMQRKLWDYILRGLVKFHLPDHDEEQRIVDIMERYRDRPADLADASPGTRPKRLDDSQHIDARLGLIHLSVQRQPRLRGFALRQP